MRLDAAWEEAESVDVIGRRSKEARYHVDSNTLMLRKTDGGGTVVEGKYDTIVHNGKVKCAGCMAEKQEMQPCFECNEMVQ